MSAVDLILPSASLWGWHVELARRLVGEGHDVACLHVDAPPRPVGLALLEAAERRLYQPARQFGVEPAAASALPRLIKDPRPHAFLVDLSGRDDIAPGAFAPLWSGVAGEAGLAACALARRAPRVGLVRDGAVLASARPAVLHPDIALAARLAAALCFCDLLLRQLGRRPLPASPVTDEHPGDAERPLPFLIGNLGAKIAQRIAGARGMQDTWRTGWRRHGGAPMISTLQWPRDGYCWLPDDGQRYYADPFLFERDGRTFLFLEEYPFATGKGVISVTELTGDAPATPHVVLERPWHLSYPLLFEEAGQIWMVPESSLGNRLEILRAVRFPDEWEVAGELVGNAALNDATFFASGGVWWMTATETTASSPWDALVIYSAPSRLGPWTRRCVDPVLVDAASARPAGHVAAVGQELRRPVQDCARIYGGALSLCRIDRIAENALAQTLLARIAPPPGASGFHTLNADARFEAVDIFEPARVSR